MNKTGLLIPLLLLCAIAQADTPQQRIRFNSLDNLTGITDNAVYAIEQDRTGFLWIGTNKGLYRFDGYETRHFRADRQNAESLLSDDVSALLVDAEGQLWIGTWSGGLHLYDESNNSFRRFDKSDGRKDPIVGIRSLAAAAGGGLWIGSWGQGLHRMSPDYEAISAIEGEIAPGVDADGLKVTAISTDDNGRVWMAAWDRGLLLYDPANGSFRQWLADENSHTASRFGRITALYRRGSTIWVGSDTGGIVCFDVRTLKPSCEIPFASGYQEQIRSIYMDESAHLWVSTLGGGLTRIDTASGARDTYIHNPASTTSINSNDVVTIFEDQAGTLWLGTLNAGVNYFEIKGQGFAHFRTDPMAETTLKSNAIQALAESAEGKVWIGTDGGGLHLFDTQTEAIEPVAISGDYYHERIWSLQAAPDGTVWIGTWGAGVYQFDPERDRVLRHLTQLNGLNDDVVTLLLLDSRQRLWIGTQSGGVSLFDTLSGELISFHHDPDNPASIASDAAASFFEDAAGNVWIGFFGAGINRYLENQAFERLPVPAADGSGLNIEDVWSIIERSDGQLWLGTSYGVGIFNPESKRFSRTLATENTPGGRVVEMLFDSAGDLWMGSDSGLYRFNESSKLIERFTRQDGLQSLSFNNGAALAGLDGTLYFGGPKGFNRFDPASIISNPIAPDVVITGIRIRNQPIVAPLDAATVRPTPAHQVQSLRLKHNENLISFEFSALHFVSPADNQYAYQLVGFDKGWNYVPATNRVAHYTNLSPGEYELRVIASNSDGVWSDVERRLAITILPPWWLTGWAFAAYLLASILLVTTLIQIRTYRLGVHAEQLKAEVKRKTQTVMDQNRTIDAQAADLREMLDSRNALFAKISHEFRTPLTLILGPLRLLKNRLKVAADHSQLDIIERNTQRVLRLVEQILGIARSENVPAARRVCINVSPVIKNIVDSFESSAAEKNLDIRTAIQDSVLVTCDPAGFEQVVLNLISNSIKYTQAGGEISLVARTFDDGAMISVSDTGIGISAPELERIFEPFYRTNRVAIGAEDGTGLGLAVVRDCVEHDDGEIEVNSSPGEGTTVTVTYPSADATVVTPYEPTTQAVQLEVATTLVKSTPRPPSDSIHRNGDAPHVLIVDDNVDILQHLKIILEPNYDCQTCQDGEEALAHIREHLPDLVISDVNMPGINGFELTQSIKTDDRTCHIPVILLTARADDESRHRGFEEHADIFMTKPFEATEMLLRVSNLFALLAVHRHGMTTRLFEDTIEDGVAASANCSARDKRFLDKLHAILETNHATAGLATKDLADAVGMSERQLQRKLKALTDYSPAELLRLFRLEKSRVLLRNGKRPADVALDVGFTSQAHFGACFKARYGVSPGQFGTRKIAAGL